MPSPKHSASTGTQQPNTADSKALLILISLTNFNAQSLSKAARAHITIRASLGNERGMN
jgi:hypothetical protein